ncbi:hypothetical protein [Asaia spathodeae]|uniref:Lysozyme inhibitor LprI N-terminal domain-containing protein n=1 Tax=Asaia spathodeae TaxID=657016 RepID=A0ABX2P3R3_9PROT|nr:hypothetical protein [Asaia spathodeae]
MILRYLITGGCLIGAVCAFSASAADGDWSYISATDGVCASVAQIRAPEADRLDAAHSALPEGCDSEALYYGIGLAADPIKARQCAYVEMAHEKDSQLMGYSGSHMLMTIYANGVGAKQDLPFALHLACVSSFAPAEQAGRVAHLNAIRQGESHGTFSFCDDASAGLTGGFCEAHRARIKAAEEENRVNAFASRLPASAQKQFRVLRNAQASWAKARADKEVDLSGTLRAAFVIQEQQLQRKDFGDMLARLEHPPLPRLGQTQLETANRRMGDDLALLAGKANLGGTTIDPAGIGEAQRAFLAYRKAWGDFAVVAYPHWGRSWVEAWVTMKRADMLDYLLRLSRQ